MKNNRPISGVYTFRDNVVSPQGNTFRTAVRNIRRVRHLGSGEFEVTIEGQGDKQVFIIREGWKARLYVNKLLDNGYVRS